MTNKEVVKKLILPVCRYAFLTTSIEFKLVFCRLFLNYFEDFFEPWWKKSFPKNRMLLTYYSLSCLYSPPLPRFPRFSPLNLVGGKGLFLFFSVPTPRYREGGSDAVRPKKKEKSEAEREKPQSVGGGGRKLIKKQLPPGDPWFPVA